jgi:hypothetical protein
MSSKATQSSIGKERVGRTMRICPNCKSQNVYVSQGGVGYDLRLQVLQDHGWMVSTLDWQTHICTDCGYFENYLTDKDWLGRIKSGEWESWKKAE